MSADYRDNRRRDGEEASAWLETVHTLSEALPYMRRYAGTTVVVKFGGHAMGDPELAEYFARDIVLLKQVGINPVVVHGGGPQIKRMLERLQIESRFVKGLRVTDAATVEVVEMVLAGSINKQVVQSIANAGGRAVGLSGKDAGLIRAQRLKHHTVDGDSNIEEVLDLGFVGTPEAIDPHPLKVMAASDMIPVVAPIGTGPEGETLNINADTAAGAIAGALQAKRLLMLTDVDGVRDGDGHLLAELTAGEARTMIADEVIAGGMIPKVETCLDAIDQGVRGAVVLDGRTPHAVLVEIFTEAGAGTLIGQR